MAAARLKSKPMAVPAAPAQRTPQRAALADAIAHHAAAVEHAIAATGAIDNGRRHAVADRAALVAAQREVTFAELREADRLIAQAQGEPEPSGPTPEEARGTVARLEETDKHHDRAVSILQARLADAHRAVGMAKDKIAAAVNAVLRADPAVRQLYIDHAEAADRYLTLRHIVTHLDTTEIRPLDVPRVSDTPDYESAKRWFGYVDALAGDADAELPS
jgi:hypothetical protein